MHAVNLTDWCAVVPSQLNRSLQVLSLGLNKIDAASAKGLADALQVIGGQRTWGRDGR
jgi:hypothetical protein